MEGELWKEIYRVVMAVSKKQKSRNGCTYADTEIVLVHLWAVLHDRPRGWALVAANWRGSGRRPRLPSNSTMSRRLPTPSVQALLQAVEQHFRDQLPPDTFRFIDAKPLPIGGCTQDRDATYGRAAGCHAKGYKLYVIAGNSRGFLAWAVHPMSRNEVSVASELIAQLNHPGYLIGDNAYDANRLYDQAAKRQTQLLAPRRKTAQGLGHHRHSPARLKAIQLIQKPSGQQLLRQRDAVERLFGQLTTIYCGLGPLPNWVRGLPRVRSWVRGKMIIFAAHRHLRRSAAA
jgi:hypothetical protein